MIGHMLKRLRGLMTPPSSESGGRILIIDPGCLNRSGHHARLNRLIADHYTSDDRATRLLVHQDCDTDLVKELGAEASLLPSIYVGLPATLEELQARLSQRNTRLYHELMSHLGSPQQNDIIIVHSITVWTISGLADWLKQARGESVRARILLMFPPDLSFVDIDRKLTTAETELLNAHFIQAVKQLGSLQIDLKIVTESESFAHVVSDQADMQIGTLPLPLDYSDHKRIQAQEEGASQRPVFFFPGAGRAEKGFYNLPGAIRRYQAAGGSGRFVVQMAEDETIATELRALPNVEILGRFVFGSDYLDLMANADAILAAYDPARYALRAGHIVMEALGSGRPVIVTRGTWMEEAAAALGAECSIVAEHFSADSLGDALIRFDQKQQALSKNAAEIAGTVRAKHNAALFVERFLNETVT